MPEHRHMSIKQADYSDQEVLFILEQYSKTNMQMCSLFVLPERMVEHIQTEGLPLFGEQLLI